MDQFGPTLSNFIKNQFPAHYIEEGPLFVAFVEEYYKWLESRSLARDEWFVPKASLVKVQNESDRVIGKGTFFFTQFLPGAPIAISKGEDTEEYDIYKIKNVSNNTLLTLTPDRIPDFSHANTRYATVSDKPNALFLTRNFPELNDIDETFDEYVLYFKEKYLKGLMFKTITNTRWLVKHSLDIYRSKGTERCVDLMYKVVFGKPASVYYPGQDIFRLSSGEWFIPQYLELTPSRANKQLINKEIVGVLSGAVAFVEEIIRRVAGLKIVEVAYISAINGQFLTGEKVSLWGGGLDIDDCPTIVGSLNEIEIDTMGSGENFEDNEIVQVYSQNGRGGLGKITGTSDITGLLSYQFIDGGYGYSNTAQLANTTGSVSVVSANDMLTGTSTLFQSEYSVGDYISVWQDTLNYQTGKVMAITSNTSLQIDSPLTFTNTSANVAYTRYFAQTYISDKILEISNVVYDTAYADYEYVPFLAPLTQPLAALNYINATGPFTVGGHIYTYTPPTTPKGEGVILSISKKTTTQGILTVSILSGDLNDNTIWTTGNVVGANLSTSNGFFDMTASANVIGNYANVTLVVNGIVGTFTNNEIITQPASQSRGTVSSYFLQNANTEAVIRISNSQGIFRNGYPVLGTTSLTTANPMYTKINLGVKNISNVFYTFANNYVSTGQMHGTVTNVSLGSGAQVTFSNDILYSENVQIWLDRIYPLRNDFLGASGWNFLANSVANLSSSIGSTLTSNTLIMGKAQGIVSTSPGTNYTAIPIIRLHEPTTYSFGLPEELILNVTDSTNFITGKLVTQQATNARGLVKDKGIGYLVVQNMKFHPDNAFVPTGNVTTIVVGEGSGTQANVISIDPRPMSRKIGDDVTVNTNVVTAGGSVTGVKILDSGFAFLNGEPLTITSGDKTAHGFAVMQTHGVGAGYYRSTDGFLSDVKKLSDGYYWQEYSYEVRSAVIDDFKRVLKRGTHVAGTKYFDALVYDSINVLSPTAQTSTTFSFTDLFRLRNADDVLMMRNGNALNLGHGVAG